MAVQRPDSGYSWVIVICCAFIHFALFGIFRSGGVMFVAILQNYDVSREEASWPFALCSAVFQLMGPAVSIITHYISQRKACLIGCAIATIGLASCYFADSVMWIMVFYGVIHGLGFGLVVTLIPVTLNQYFVKYRATAIGMAFSGGTLSSLVFPAAMDWMLETYSLKESFLLLSGVVMNTLVASCFLRAPPWVLKAKDTKIRLLEEGSDAKDSGVSTSDDNNHASKEAAVATIYKITTDQISENNQSLFEKVTTQQSAFSETNDNVNESLQDLSSSVTVDKPSDNRNSDTLYSNNDSVLFDSSYAKIASDKSHMTCDGDYKNDPDVQKPLMSNDQIIVAPKKNLKESEEGDTARSRAFHSISTILKQPVFYLITFTMSIYFLGVHSFFMVIVDFAKDKGIPEHKGIYIISVFSITDFFGRACLGWITDRNYISRKTMVALNLCVLGVLYQIYPVIYSLQVILAVAAINGLAVGSSITLFFVLQAECLGMKRLTLVIGLTSFINGCLSLLRPGVIGLFRDNTGSYNWMFHFLGIVSILFSIIWAVEAWRTKEPMNSNRVKDKKARDIKDAC